MNVESWITVEETPALAAAAMSVIDARLARLTQGERDTFWASIRKAYNTPYNDPAKPSRPQPNEPVPAPAIEIRMPALDPAIDLPAAALASATLASATLASEALAAEIRAA